MNERALTPADRIRYARQPSTAARHAHRYVLWAFLLTGLAGCGGGGNSDTATPPPSPPPNPPAPTTYNIGGTVSGLTGTGLALQNNSGDTLAINANGAFTFATPLANSAAYNVTVSTQPGGQTCTVAAGSGTVASAAVTNVAVSCADNPPPPPPPPAAPLIVRQPRSLTTLDHGAALFFVVASGTSLNYEWRSVQFGTVLKSGPEPFLLRSGLLHPSDDGNCYTVTVSNGGGNVVSGEACVNIEEVDYDFNEDGGSFEADGDLAMAFGNTLLAFIENTIGGLTGPRPAGLEFLLSPLTQGGPCGYSGSRFAPTLDGVEIDATTPLPLGQHSVSIGWNDCRVGPDDLAIDGAILATYDFPSEIGVGTYTMHFGGYKGLNGSADITVTRATDASNRKVDSIRIVQRDNFTMEGAPVVFRQNSVGSDRIDVERRLDSSGPIPIADRAEVDFNDMYLSFYDVEGIVASVADTSGFNVVFNFDGTATGDVDVRTTAGPIPAAAHTEFMGTLEPAGDGSSWSFELVIPDDT